MSKNLTEVVIQKKIYQLNGTESKEYLQKLAHYIDQKIEELSQTKGYDKMSTEYQNVLLSVNLADEYFQCRRKLEQIEAERAEKDRQMYEVKHKMIDAVIQCETLNKLVSEYKNEIIRQQKEIVKLQQEGTDE